MKQKRERALLVDNQQDRGSKNQPGDRGQKGRDNHSQAPMGVGIYLLLVPGLPLSLCPTTGGGGGVAQAAVSAPLILQERDSVPGRRVQVSSVSWIPCFAKTCWEQITKKTVPFIRNSLALGQLSKIWSSHLEHTIPSSSLPVQSNVTSSVKPSGNLPIPPPAS